MSLPEPTYGMIVAENVMVPMRDGVRLATDIYRPMGEDGNPLPGPFPTIVYRTSYDKSNPVAHIEPVARSRIIVRRTGSIWRIAPSSASTPARMVSGRSPGRICTE